MRTLGVDVGGTNTDAALLDDGRLVAAVKVPTSADLVDGVVGAVGAVLAAAGGGAAGPDAVMIGTTQFTNAVVERRRLERIAAIRIGLPSGASLPPTVDWPADLRAAVSPLVVMVAGGHEFDGRPLVPLDRDALRSAAEEIGRAGIGSVAISAVFSPLNAEAEQAAAEIVAAEVPGVAISCSGDFGRIGLLERENVTLLNAALRGLGRRTVAAFGTALRAAGVEAPVFLTRNDGTIVAAEVAAETPVQCFASGPTNSMRGAATLSGLRDAIVIDVGGTTSDIGHLRDGFPRPANGVVDVGGVRTLFRMPDLVPLGLGGGSIVAPDGSRAGPRSVGFRITEEARVFGGPTLTATDVAVAAGIGEVGDPSLVGDLDPLAVRRCLDRVRTMIEDGLYRVRTSAEPVELVAVGGASFLVPDGLDGVRTVHRVEHAHVANAVGAAIAQVSGEVDQVFEGRDRSAAIDAALALATERAVRAGADPATLEVVEVEDLPLAYLRGGARRVHARVVGDVSLAPSVVPGRRAVGPFRTGAADG